LKLFCWCNFPIYGVDLTCNMALDINCNPVHLLFPLGIGLVVLYLVYKTVLGKEVHSKQTL